MRSGVREDVFRRLQASRKVRRTTSGLFRLTKEGRAVVAPDDAAQRLAELGYAGHAPFVEQEFQQGPERVKSRRSYR